MPLLKSGGYGHRVRHFGGGAYLISWNYDTKRGRIRYPRKVERVTSQKGAERFAKKWNLELPKSEAA